VADLRAPAHWRAVDVVSDLHLDVGNARTAQAFTDYLTGCDADAVIILGDLFEVWVGDDVLVADARQGPEAASRHFVQSLCTALRRCADQRALYIMCGNRDFLYGPAFSAYTHAQLLADPGEPLLITPGGFAFGGQGFGQRFEFDIIQVENGRVHANLGFCRGASLCLLSRQYRQ